MLSFLTPAMSEDLYHMSFLDSAAFVLLCDLSTVICTV
jgi:hypothetical protein